jgi:transposase-like protein
MKNVINNSGLIPAPIASNDDFKDALNSVLREGARDLLARAVSAELALFLEAYADKRDENGHKSIVRNGYLPKRSLQTGLGDIAIEVPRTRDRSGEGVVFSSKLLPPYLKRTASLEALLPYLYLKGLSSNDFEPCLKALLGENAKGLSPSTILRMREGWRDDYALFGKRQITKKYAYIWADGVYLEAREDEKQCLLVIIGVDETGKKELLAIENGMRESELSWSNLLLGLKTRGLEAPLLGIADGALGFWKALSKIYPTTKHQLCWLHKSRNILNKLPDSLQIDAKSALDDIWQKADTKAEALKNITKFEAMFGDKYPKAVESLTDNQSKLLTFFDFPAAHWRSIRTTNVVESPFATLKNRTQTMKGCLSADWAEIMTYQLLMEASKNWIRLNKSETVMTKLMKGEKFINGILDNNTTIDNHNLEMNAAA